MEENADGIRRDWPRILLPSSLEQFKASATLGQRVADLLVTERPAAGVTVGALRPELRSVVGLKHMDGKSLDSGEDLQLTAGWGHAGKEGVTMSGRGKLVSQERTAKELAGLAQGLVALGIAQDEGLKHLGSTVVDVYLNDLCAWTNVPEMVWGLYIGGYQVMRKCSVTGSTVFCNVRYPWPKPRRCRQWQGVSPPSARSSRNSMPITSK